MKTIAILAAAALLAPHAVAEQSEAGPGDKTITMFAGRYWATVQNTYSNSVPLVTFNGPLGVKTWTFRSVDLLRQVLLSDKGLLAFTAETTGDPIVQVVDYGGEQCGSCDSWAARFDHPDNNTGAGSFPFRPWDEFPGPNPFGWVGLNARAQCPLLLNWEDNGDLRVILRATWYGWTGDGRLAVPNRVSLRTPGEVTSARVLQRRCARSNSDRLE